MGMRIFGDHIAITEPLKEYANEKLGKLSHHFNQIIDIHLTLKIVKDNRKERQEASAEVFLPKKTVYAEAVEDDMYAAIDTLYSKLDPQVKKHKDKMKSRNKPIL